jgi:hypothetical protein
MADDLNVNIVLEQPVAIKENGDDQHTKGLKQIEGIPEDISVRCLQLIFKKCPYRIINGVPEAQQQISPLPNPWYILKDFQSLKFGVKLSNEKEKHSERPS